MVDEGVVDLGAVGVNVAPRVWRQRQVIIGVDVEGVDLGSRPVVVGEDDVEVPLAKVLVEASRRGSLMMFAKALQQQVLGGGFVGVDAEGVSEAPSCRRVGGGESSWFCRRPSLDGGEGPPENKCVLAEVMLVKSPKMMVKPLCGRTA